MVGLWHWVAHIILFDTELVIRLQRDSREHILEISVILTTKPFVFSGIPILDHQNR